MVTIEGNKAVPKADKFFLIKEGVLCRQARVDACGMCHHVMWRNDAGNRSSAVS
jgi:hypothetical protein